MLTTLKTTAIVIFMVGDVMTGRGIDQILPHPSAPILYEGYVTDARRYVQIAERINGPIPRDADFSYVWGDALDELERLQPDLRLINLETAVTASDLPWPGKGINYRMHPDNLGVLSAARIDGCTLANNHLLDWERQGLTDTLRELQRAGLNCVGAGENRQQARAPAIFTVPQRGRLLVFSVAHSSSGVPSEWAATEQRSGVNLLADLSEASVQQLARQIASFKRPGDLVLLSIHWGGNWGYTIPETFRSFAHRLIDHAGVDIIHGHSSHHVMGIEVYHDRPIFYGCGDFLNDYEGISGYERFRAELGLMYFVSSDPQTGRLLELRMVPTRIHKFRIQRASREERKWLENILNQEGQALGTRVEQTDDGDLLLRWNVPGAAQE
jgi:poly-gamma-glutamate synthesis protein (capsule biosynthesis protein)